MTASEKTTASEGFTILVKSKETSGENMEALKVFLVVVAFIGSFAFGTLGRYESPEDDSPSRSVPVLLSLFFLSGATAILLYIAVVGTLTIACYYRLRNLHSQFREYVFNKMMEKIVLKKNVEFSEQDCTRGNQKDWEIDDTYGTHLVTCTSTDRKEAEDEIEKIVQESVREIFQEEEKHCNALEVRIMFWDLKDFFKDCGEIRKHRRKFQKWKKIGKDKGEKAPEFTNGSQFYELSTIKWETKSYKYRPRRCVYYPCPISLYTGLFWGWHIRGSLRLFPFAIVFLMAGQALDICASENSGILEIVILAVWFVPFSILVGFVSRILLLSILTR